MSELIAVGFVSALAAVLFWVVTVHVIAYFVREYRTRKALAYGQRLIEAVHQQIEREAYELRNFENFHNVIDARNKFH